MSSNPSQSQNRQSDGTRFCKECGRETHPSGIAGKPKHVRGYCNPCYKRLVWRALGTPALERDKAASRDAKRRRRAAGEAC